MKNEKLKQDDDSHFPVIRRQDKKIISYIDNFGDIPVQVSMEVDKEHKVLAKRITPLNELFA